jgi:hypothetical protein
VARAVLAGAERGAPVAAWLVDLALVAVGSDLRCPGGALAWAGGRLRCYPRTPGSRVARGRDARCSSTSSRWSLADAISDMDCEPHLVLLWGAMAFGALVEIFVRVHAAGAGVPRDP